MSLDESPDTVDIPSFVAQMLYEHPLQILRKARSARFWLRTGAAWARDVPLLGVFGRVIYTPCASMAGAASWDSSTRRFQLRKKMMKHTMLAMKDTTQLTG